MLITKLRTQAIIFAITLGTLPVLGCGIIAYYFATRSFSQEIKNSQKTLVSGLQEKVNLFMRDRFGDIQVMANLDIFTDPKLRTITTAQEKAAALNQIIKAYGIYNSIGLFDINGNVIAQTEGDPLGNHLDRTYVQEALKIDSPVLSQPAVSTSSGIFSVYSASPIKDKVTGKTIGFIRARMPVKYLEEAIENYGSKKREYYLINASGEVFIGPEGAYVTESLSSGSEADNTQAEYEAVKAEKIFPALAQLQTANEPVTTISNNARINTKELIAYAPATQLNGLPELNWQAIVAQNTKDAFAPQRQLLWTIVVGTGVTALVSSGLAIIFADRTTKFFQGITNAIASSSNEIASTFETEYSFSKRALGNPRITPSS